jgi:membrane protease YdiL (CAAX protease family)
MSTLLNSGNSISKSIAWRNAIAITLLGCLMGWAGFVVLGDYLPKRMDLFQAAVVLYLAFGAALGIIFAVIVLWQRRRGSSLAELGWRRPTTKTALTIAFVLGVLYTAGAYFGARAILKDVDVTEFNWTRVALIPLGVFMGVAEETMMRGFFMNELKKARVAVWLQIVASGACSAVYHAIHNPTWEGFLPSFVLFTLHAGLYVAGKRSLTPVSIAHGMYNVLGEPYLLMMALATMPH